MTAQPTYESQSTASTGPIVFYDGECGLCDRSVRFLMARDPAAALRYAPLQGETAKRMLPEERRRDLDSVVLVDEGGTFLRSTAMLRALSYTGGAWRGLARAGLAVPRPIRDACYRFIAKRRIALFGGAESCLLPSMSERKRFLP